MGRPLVDPFHAETFWGNLKTRLHHDDVIKWKHFPRYWPFGDRWPVNSSHKVTRSFDVSFDLRPNKRLSKQLWGWWFVPSSRSLWRQCNVPFLDVELVQGFELFSYRTFSESLAVCKGKPRVTNGFPLKWASDTESVYISWRQVCNFVPSQAR